jgi:hypothetical protein
VIHAFALVTHLFVFVYDKKDALKQAEPGLRKVGAKICLLKYNSIGVNSAVRTGSRMITDI